MDSFGFNIVPFPADLKVAGVDNGQSPLSDSSEIVDGTIGEAPLAQNLVATSKKSASKSDATGFNLQVEDFDGPIDLLLHLVKRNELPIEKLSLAKVADQFLLCVQQSVVHDLEMAGEYLVIAANLLSIKAALLLDPKADRTIYTEDGPDPHEELLNRLRAAAVYQEAAKRIGSRDILGLDVFAANLACSKTGAGDPALQLADHDSSLLEKALRKIIARMPSNTAGLVINWNRMSVADKMKSLVDRLISCGEQAISFEQLVASEESVGAFEPRLISLPNLVTSFIAILELNKRAIVAISQSGFQEEIMIALRSDNMTMGATQAYNGLEDLFQSEFDVEPQAVNLN